MKQCEICTKEIPEEYKNLLCDDCYKVMENENERRKSLDEEMKNEPPRIITKADIAAPATKQKDPIIQDENYQENPEMEDKPQWEANFNLFKKHTQFIWHPTRDMYTFIKNQCLDRVVNHPQYPKFIWRPKIVDVGCGTGTGSNILSQEADFVWGIDKNEKSIEFAKQMFTRLKNGIYYSSEIKFDCLDIITDTRTFMKFDIVVAIEVFEHIDDWRTFISNLIKHFDNGAKDVKGHDCPPTEYFISTPNRNNRHIRKDKPYNPYHVRELSHTEFQTALETYFKKVEIFKSNGEPTNGEMNHTPILAKCSMPV